jgi:hypothetical protein
MLAELRHSYYSTGLPAIPHLIQNLPADSCLTDKETKNDWQNMVRSMKCIYKKGCTGEEQPFSYI